MSERSIGKDGVLIAIKARRRIVSEVNQGLKCLRDKSSKRAFLVLTR